MFLATVEAVWGIPHEYSVGSRMHQIHIYLLGRRGRCKERTSGEGDLLCVRYCMGQGIRTGCSMCYGPVFRFMGLNHIELAIGYN